MILCSRYKKNIRRVVFIDNPDVTQINKGRIIKEENIMSNNTIISFAFSIEDGLFNFSDYKNKLSLLMSTDEIDYADKITHAMIYDTITIKKFIHESLCYRPKPVSQVFAVNNSEIKPTSKIIEYTTLSILNNLAATKLCPDTLSIKLSYIGAKNSKSDLYEITLSSKAIPEEI